MLFNSQTLLFLQNSQQFLGMQMINFPNNSVSLSVFLCNGTSFLKWVESVRTGVILGFLMLSFE